MVVSRHNDIVPHVVIHQLLVLGLLQAGLLPGAGLQAGRPHKHVGGTQASPNHRYRGQLPS